MRFPLLLFLLIILTTKISADDLLITRAGTEYKGKLDMLSDKEVSFIVKSGGFLGDKARQVFPTENIYHIKTDKRGSIFFNRKRERVMLPVENFDKSANIIYLVDGGEIPAWGISLKDGVLTFQKSKKAMKAISNTTSMSVSDVFMIKYSDGSKDIFTEISNPPEPEKNKNRPTGDKKIKVILYKVLKGETLSSIANKYDVPVDDLREWNDIPSKTGNKDKLNPGDQLMIQIETDK